MPPPRRENGMSSRMRTLRLRRRAIVYGCLADLGATIAGRVPLLYYAVSRNSDLESLLNTTQSAGYVGASLMVGLAATCLGGYVAARKSPRAELTNALAVGVVMAVLSILFQVLIRVPLDPWEIPGIVLTIPVGLTGGLVRLSQLERSTAPG